MTRLVQLRRALIGGASVCVLAHPAAAKEFDVPPGDLQAALDVYTKQAGVQLIYSDDAVRGHRSRGARGDYTELAALTKVLSGTGFTTTKSMLSDAIGIVPGQSAPQPVRVAQAAPRPRQSSAPVETVVVTAEKKTEDIQTVPIAVSAFTQKELTQRQIAGGPDLVKEVPNLTFSKTNFSGYNLEIRGIGTQAISVTTDPAVAVAFNGIPFIRNHFFEQEFYDLDNLEVLRGPQGTLYGRNATAGVVNVISAKPTDTYAAALSGDIGNYSSKRVEGMLNVPIVGDKLDLRIAGEWTNRKGYSKNDITNTPIDGRDLWSARATLAWKPTSNVDVQLVWEHFSEDDDRLRSGKQLCTPVPEPDTIDGVPTNSGTNIGEPRDFLSQGCGDGSLYSPAAFGVPNGKTLPYWLGVQGTWSGIIQDANPYAGTTQSPNLRVISSGLNPTYRAKNDTLELNANWTLSPSLTLTSQTGYNQDFLWSAEDYNRFATQPGVFHFDLITNPTFPSTGIDAGNNFFCDPQLGCQNRLMAEDLSKEHAWQFSQELRLASNYNGPLNFSVGGNYLHYETVEDYYVFINTLTLIALFPCHNNGGAWVPGVTTDATCLAQPHQLASGGGNVLEPSFIDPNPIGALNNQGHNYFLSQNPYVLNSYAMFGELYYQVADDLKLTAGIRWTEDRKHFIDIPSEVLTYGYGYPSFGTVDQQWDAPTGRLVASWTPHPAFTDNTLIYGSVARGYKAGGANPPGAQLLTYEPHDVSNPIHPLYFKPEYITAYELGTKNELLDGTLTLNGDIFYYDYKAYQISEIVDRTAINLNFNAHVEGAEFESTWEPIPGLKFSLAQGFEDSGLAGGSKSVDLLDRTAGTPGWLVVRPFVGNASNCILPDYVVVTLINNGTSNALNGACGAAYNAHLDPATGAPYVPDPPGVIETTNAAICPGVPSCGVQYPGFNPLTAPNNGQGFDKNLGGHQLPNAPHFTTSMTAEYTMAVWTDWAATLHADFYYQSQQWARVFEDQMDRIRGYTTTNFSLILNSANGWQLMAYLKNAFNATAITGTFLNSDDTDLTTNVFLTDPRLFGLRVTKTLDQNDGFWGSDYSGFEFFTGLFSDADNGKPPLWIELGGQFDLLNDGEQLIDPPFYSKITHAGFASPLKLEHLPVSGFEESVKISLTPGNSDWVVAASVRYGRNSRNQYLHQQTNNRPPDFHFFHCPTTCSPTGARFRYAETKTSSTEAHAIFDFMAGKDVGLGLLGLEGSSVVSGGVRFAQLRTWSSTADYSDPDYTNPNVGFNFNGPKYFHQFSVNAHNKKSFIGAGPAVSWQASTPLDANNDYGQITFDWGANGALLFGRQKSRGLHQTKGKLSTGLISFPPFFHYNTTHYTHAAAHNRSRIATVPNLGAMAGLSYRYRNAKVSFGYRIDEFFGAMDGGIDARKSYNFGDSGPFVNLSLGLGG